MYKEHIFPFCELRSWLTSFCISALADAIIWSTFAASLLEVVVFAPLVVEPTEEHVQFFNFFSNKFLVSLSIAISSASLATSLKCLWLSLTAAFFTFPITSSNFFVSFFNFRYSPSCEALIALKKYRAIKSGSKMQFAMFLLPQFAHSISLSL